MYKLFLEWFVFEGFNFDKKLNLSMGAKTTIT